MRMCPERINMGTPGLNVDNTIQGMGDRVEKRRVKKKPT